MSVKELKYKVKFLDSFNCISDYHTAITNFFSNLKQEKFNHSFEVGDAKICTNEFNYDELKEIIIIITCTNIKNDSDLMNFASQINKQWCKESHKNARLQWLEPDNNYINSSTFITYGNLRTNEIAFGTLPGMKDFVQSYHFREIKNVKRSSAISSVLCSFHHLKKEVTLCVSNTHKSNCRFTGEMGHKITFKYDSVIRILANTNPDSSAAEVFFQLEYPPFITISCSDKAEADSSEDSFPRARVTKAKEIEYATEKFQRTFQIGCSCNYTLCSSKCLGKNFVLKLVVEDKFQCRWNLEQFILRSSKKAEICYTSVNTHILKNESKVKSKYIFNIISHSRCLSELEKFDCEYALNVLFSRSNLILHQISLKNIEMHEYVKILFDKLSSFAESNSSTFVKALYYIADVVDKGIMFIFLSILKEKFLYFCHYVELNEIPNGMAYVRRVLITPSRIIFLQPYEHFDNRIIRRFGVEYMIRASIQDDDYSKLTFAVQYNSEKEEIMHNVVGKVLLDGIVIGSRTYEPLAASTSQLREHGIWLYAKDKNGHTASSIRQWMGNFHSIKNVAKFMARMGQCLSSTETGVQIHLENKNEKYLDDIKSHDGRYTFSDGIGIISSELAEEVRQVMLQNSASDLKIDKGSGYTPVAFQIRYKGCKGMVVENPISGRILGIRPSMKKFECKTSSQLEIVKTSQPTKLFLNKHLITILEQMGIAKEAFLHLEVKMILHLLDSLMDEKVAADLLTQNLSPIFPFNDLRKAGLSLTSDPFFRSLLLAYFKSFAEKLKTNMRIAIPDQYGRNMLGVLDETKSLKYGEVFVQYSKSLTDPNAGFEILKEPVIVTKNPSLHPGDVRKLIAVDAPALHHIKDCIVFPACGKRPHPDEMAGSDLDGDEMVVLWYKPLIFHRNSAKPMEYPVYEEKCPNNNIQLDDMVAFFCQYIQNDNIGTFAHAHLVWADMLKQGIFSKKCMDIAKRYPYVLDFAKHGTTECLRRSERPMQYPDFLQKGIRGNTYHSKKVLGSLYRTSRVLDACSSKISLMCETSTHDPDLEYPGWQLYEKSAELHRCLYTAKVLEILNRYNLSSEAEAFSGMIKSVANKKWREEKFNAIKILKRYLINILGSYRNIFLQEVEEECKKLSRDEKLKRKFQRASAWYMVVYGKKSEKVLSFPWLLSDILSVMKKNVMKDKCPSPFKVGCFLNDIDSDIKQWSYTQSISQDEGTCLCNRLLKRITTEWICKSGLNFGESKENVYCDSCYQRIFTFFESESKVFCCSGSSVQTCTCKKNCFPAKLVLNFMKFFIVTVPKISLGHCQKESCNGFLPKNLHELSLQTYSYLAVTRNIFYLGITFSTNNFTKNAIPSDATDYMFEEEGDPIKIPVNPILKEMIENHMGDIAAYLKKCSGVKDITLTPEKNAMCLIVNSIGRNWQRWNLQEILLDTGFTENLKICLNI